MDKKGVRAGRVPADQISGCTTGRGRLREIAWRLHYSSVAHLSNQFKKITGLTPFYFKSLKRKKRNTLENV